MTSHQFIADAEKALGKPLGKFTREELTQIRQEEQRKLDEANAGLAVTAAAAAIIGDTP